MISILTVTECNSQQNQEKFANKLNDVDSSILDFYRQYSSFTDPGEYEYLYENLPDSLPELCRLIRTQYINPYELDRYGAQIPKERLSDRLKYPTVKSALEGLLSYDSSGLVRDRKPEDRLVLICRDNAILLASILKYRGIPARVRYGFAPYLMPEFHSSHVICEVWNENNKRWMLVDPSTDMIDFSREEFDFSNDVWLKMQKEKIDPQIYGRRGKYTGLLPITMMVCGDLASILGSENTTNSYPPILDYAIQNNNQLTSKHIEALNRISELMKSMDPDNITKLQEIYDDNPQIQFTESFYPNATKTGSIVQQNQEKRSSKLNDADSSILGFYRQYSSFTDPGEYEYLYENLPDSLPELCNLIRSQFIHPYAELPRYRELIPKERWNEALKYPTVKSVLEGLISYDSSGIVKNRKPENRLVLGCRHNAILLASILKYRGIPARVRIGHVTYLKPGFHLSHTICEVWNKSDRRWMLVDPSTAMVDFSREKFDFSNDLWLKMQNGEIDPNQYGFPGRYSGLVSILGKVCPDLASILGTEYPVNQYAPILDYAFDDDNQIPDEHIKTLNRISKLMKSIDADNILKLQDIYNNTPEIQITKSFMDKMSESAKDENKISDNNQSIDKPNIEFTDIPGGTFTMGSTVDEEGRKDDEIQHEVTLSAFKMSIYPITVEQYNIFCDATGRYKPRYGRNGHSKMPVSQVTWHDANAFAEWMGCRLPTEAEFEYAARANTSSPFYTGDCLTTEQANFNGKESYINCEKSENRKKPLAVGNFSPNAFGLYDMHGNMWEWTNDWYGEYDIDDTLNPKGAETGTRKVDRGGGYWDPAWRCRSAYRGGGDPPGNRGAGLSFRVVKSE